MNLLAPSMLLLACAADPLERLATPQLGVGTTAPEFSLADVNATSASFGEQVSPSQYLDRVSAWYFGHAT